MSRANNRYYYYAEITIEAVSPLVLASGKSGIFSDVELVRDANGLPAIPGSTIAGILRHAAQREIGDERTNRLFGFQEKNDGHSSSLEVSWAYVHDSKNCIHKYFYPMTEIERDPILSELVITDNPDFKRDHVKLTGKGVAENKFDRCFVPAGSRFTFSLGFWSDAGNDENWNKMLKLFFSSSFRIGAAGRDGYGKIKVIEIRTPSKECFDLSKLEDVKNFRFCEKKYELCAFVDDLEKLELKLKFPLGFRIGGGFESILNSDHIPDMLPYSEKVINWNGDKGFFSDKPKITIPGSALKGALRHRAAFHLARIAKRWASDQAASDDGLSELFGFAVNNKSPEASGQAGKLWFTDLYLEDAKTYELSRNSIDRFTGGTLNGALFQEENVSASQAFETCIYLDKSVKKDGNEYKAFKWALEDLKAGRLALGGGSGHGLGFNVSEERD